MMLYVIVLCSVMYSTLLAGDAAMVASPEPMQQATSESGRQSWRQIQ